MTLKHSHEKFFWKSRYVWIAWTVLKLFNFLAKEWGVGGGGWGWWLSEQGQGGQKYMNADDVIPLSSSHE